MVQNMINTLILEDERKSIKERLSVIKNLEELMHNHLEAVKDTPSYHQAILKMFFEHKGHYKNIEACYAQMDYEDKTYIVERYANNYERSYQFVDTECLKFEERLWRFAIYHPIKWAKVTQNIAHDEKCSDINTYEGIILLNSIIHNGIYGDWHLNIALKDNNMVLLSYDSPIEKSFIDQGYKITYADQENLIKCLDKLDNKKNVEFNNIYSLQKRKYK